MEDFERLADLDFGLMVWRQNLKRGTSLAYTRQVQTFTVLFCLLKNNSPSLGGWTCQRPPSRINAQQVLSTLQKCM